MFARSAVPLRARVRNVSRKRASYAVEIREGVAGQPRRRVGFLDRLDPGVERSFVSLELPAAADRASAACTS
jgi:hypothetical protein